MRATLLVSTFALAAAGSGWPPSAYASAKNVLAKMNLTQKMLMVHGSGGSYVGDTPAVTLSDGTVVSVVLLGA